MKALAKEPDQRYPNVGELRKDIERYQEGRSVSAKHDTFKEMAWKLVKRNQGISATAAAALLVLAVSAGLFLKSNYAARVQAETERGKAETERGKAEAAYQAYQDQVRGSVPVLLRVGKAALNERKFGDALVQANLAVKSDPDSAEARLLKGKLLITRKRFAEAASELEAYRKLKGDDAEVQPLLKLCRTAQPEDMAALLAFAGVFTQHSEHALADGVLSGEGKTALSARQRLLEIYRQRIEAAWHDPGNKLTMSVQGQYTLFSRPAKEIPDLTPLRGIPLTRLDLFKNDQIRDLEPLRGMPLTYLRLWHCSQVRTLEPLKGMSLTDLNLQGTQVHDLSPLQGMPLTSLTFAQTQVRTLEPLRGMPLTSLAINSLVPARELELLKNMPLTSLSLAHTQVRDLSLLKGMQLTSLKVDGTQVGDLSPLKGMPLKELFIHGTGVTDLTPLRGMELEDIRLTPKNITQGLDILRDMKSLKTIGIYHINDFWPTAEFWARYDKGEFKK
jgi:hypothetical protein